MSPPDTSDELNDPVRHDAADTSTPRGRRIFVWLVWWAHAVARDFPHVDNAIDRLLRREQ